MRKILYIIPVILLSACTGKHILFQNGNSEYSIVIDKDAPASEQYAACELQSWLREVGGVSLPIVGTDEGEQGKRLSMISSRINLGYVGILRMSQSLQRLKNGHFRSFVITRRPRLLCVTTVCLLHVPILYSLPV